MVFCMDNVQNSAHLSTIISDSLWSENATSERVLARLYLISDILHNSTLVSATHCFWTYRKYFEFLLPYSVEKMSCSLRRLDLEDQSQFIREFAAVIEVGKVYQAWQSWNIFDKEYLTGLTSVVDINLAAGHPRQAKSDLYFEMLGFESDELKNKCREVENYPMAELEAAAKRCGIDWV